MWKISLSIIIIFIFINTLFHKYSFSDWLPQALKDRNEGEEVNQEQNFECVQNLGDEIIEMPIDKNVNVGETLNDGENTHNVIQEFRRAIYCLEQNGRCENIIRWLKRELLARFSGRNSGMGVEYPRN